MTSQTTEVTIYRQVPFLPSINEKVHLVNLVDVPGYQDTEGRDSEHLDKMTDYLRKECPKIDMFVLCFESGTKFDTGI